MSSTCHRILSVLRHTIIIIIIIIQSWGSKNKANRAAWIPKLSAMFFEIHKLWLLYAPIGIFAKALNAILLSSANEHKSSHFFCLFFNCAAFLHTRLRFFYPLNIREWHSLHIVLDFFSFSQTSPVSFYDVQVVYFSPHGFNSLSSESGHDPVSPHLLTGRSRGKATQSDNGEGGRRRWRWEEEWEHC